MTENKMVGWHHLLNGDEFEQAPGDGEGQRSLACYNSWSGKELYMTEQLNNSNKVCSVQKSLCRSDCMSGYHCLT